MANLGDRVVVQLSSPGVPLESPAVRLRDAETPLKEHAELPLRSSVVAVGRPSVVAHRLLEYAANVKETAKIVLCRVRRRYTSAERLPCATARR